MPKKEKLSFRFERKRIKTDKKLPPLCKDYKPNENTGNCKRADICKNATYGFEGKKMGTCYGGTKSSEREDRKERIRRLKEKVFA